MKHSIKAGLLSTALLVSLNAFAGSVPTAACESLGTGCNKTNSGISNNELVGRENYGISRAVIKDRKKNQKINDSPRE